MFTIRRNSELEVYEVVWVFSEQSVVVKKFSNYEHAVRYLVSEERKISKLQEVASKKTVIRPSQSLNS